jgi:DNA-binding YbaB/EbfC family protein
MQNRGAMGGMSEMMRQAARMQRKIDEAKAAIKDVEVTATTAGDKVKAVVTCEGKIKQFHVDPEFLQQEGLELALDALAAAANTALAEADRKVDDHINKVTGVKAPLR